MATTNKNLAQPSYNSLSWDTPLNSNFGIIDAALGGSTSTIDLSASNYTLSTADSQKMRLVLGGSLSTNRTLTFPAGVGGMWIVSNGTTGSAFSVTLTTGSGVTQTAPQGYNLIVFSDGTNIYIADNGLVNKITSFVDLTVSNILTLRQIVSPSTVISVTAGSFIVGQTYTITLVGSTDFTLIGAASNTVGLKFVATGVGTGNGTADTVSETILLKGNVNVTGRITPRVNSSASYSSPLAWNSDNFDQYVATAQANALTINADSGTPVDGQKMTFRFLDNGTARALTWTTGTSKSFRAVGITLPTTTVANKTMYVGCVYNSNATRWDAVAYGIEA